MTIICVFLCELKPVCLSGTEPTAMEPFNQGAEPSNQSAAPEDRGETNIIERIFRQFSRVATGATNPLDFLCGCEEA